MRDIKPIDYNEIKKWAREVADAESKKRVGRLTYEQAMTKEAIENKTPCEKCGKTDKQSLDHIVPRDILKQIGVDWEKVIIPENLRILCIRCNHFKGNQLDFSTPKTKEILIKLLNEV